MKYLLRLSTVLLALFLVSGCEFYPMGLNEQQWKALTPDQQAEYRARQYEIDQENRRQEEARRAIEEREQRERAERERYRIAELYRHARQGDVVTVTIQGGLVAFYGKRHEYEPMSFDLVRGERRMIEFRRQGRGDTTQVEVALSEDGNTFYFDYPSRRRYVLVNREWSRGEEYRPPEIRGNDGHSEAIGLTIHLRHKRLDGRPRR